MSFVGKRVPSYRCTPYEVASDAEYGFQRIRHHLCQIESLAYQMSEHAVMNFEEAEQIASAEMAIGIAADILRLHIRNISRRTEIEELREELNRRG